MKSIFRFATMALAAVVLMGGGITSCDLLDDNKDNNEQTDNSGDQTGDNNNGGGVEAITLDGKQWISGNLFDGAAFCFDFGVTIEGEYLEGNVSLNTESPAYYKFAEDAMGGEYVIDASSENAGTITCNHPMYGTSEYQYKELTATSVKIDASCVYGSPTEFIVFTIPTQKIVQQ